ncbi:unnamed protein product [Linum trigynum]|uniref:Uncharacterized protein n=1 Tax=Linum trigynum TaxID=586398 RepID=A0AAV2E389_9ROSI
MEGDGRRDVGWLVARRRGTDRRWSRRDGVEGGGFLGRDGTEWRLAGCSWVATSRRIEEGGDQQREEVDRRRRRDGPRLRWEAAVHFTLEGEVRGRRQAAAEHK